MDIDALHDLERDVALRKKKRRAETAISAFMVIALYLAIATIAVTLYGWLTMLFIGMLWHEFGWLAPVGYIPGCAIGIVLMFVYWAWQECLLGDDENDDDEP